MTDHTKTKIAKDWILKLANGINPLDGSAIRDDDTVSNVHISRCLFYVAGILDSVLYAGGKKTKEYPLEFHIAPEERKKIVLSEKAGITALVREINRTIPEDMRPLSVARVQDWLLDSGYLEETQKEDGGKTKRPTEYGLSIGLTTEARVGHGGPYTAVLYSIQAQRMILDHLDAIAGGCALPPGSDHGQPVPDAVPPVTSAGLSPGAITDGSTP